MKNWDYFDKFEEIINTYMLPSGEGDTVASQAVTAVNKLIYKWYNDGDVFDNTHYLDGWANDLSSYANWLAKNIKSAEEVLDRIESAYNDSDYEDLLADLAEVVLNADRLKELAKINKIGSIYNCKGDYKFIEDKYGEDEDDEGWYDDEDEDNENDESDDEDDE